MILLNNLQNYKNLKSSFSGPNLLVFGFLIDDASLLKKITTSIDIAVSEKLFLVRLNKMELKKERNEYRWKETYIIKSIDERINIEKTNYRSLWFIGYNASREIIGENNIIVDQKNEEPTGIKGLKGVTIYGKFKG